MRKLLILLTVLAAGCAVPTPVLFKASMAPVNPDDPALTPELTARRALQRYYPQLARKTDGGQETVFFVTTSAGAVQRTDLVRGAPAAGSELDALYRRFPDLRALESGDLTTRVTRFHPGAFGPGEVVVVWALMSKRAHEPRR